MSIVYMSTEQIYLNSAAECALLRIYDGGFSGGFMGYLITEILIKTTVGYPKIFLIG